jgi:hypothetical protein
MTEVATRRDLTGIERFVAGTSPATFSPDRRTPEPGSGTPMAHQEDR